MKKIIALLVFATCFLPQAGRAFEVMQPLVYKEGIDLSGWLMSEKLDGVRAYWDGKRLLSKNGVQFNPPATFTENFPNFEVEGELWGGRNTFEKTVSIVTQKDAHIGWLELKFAIFDVPKASGGFEDRLNKAGLWFGRHPSEFAFIIDHKAVTGEESLRNELEMIEKVGGEGIILRRSGSPYTHGRSKDVLKLKSYSDMEAVVVGHLGGEGRNAGRMGALLVELPHDKTRFKIGTGFSDEVRENPPPVGTIIIFKYYGFYNSGIPKYPSYLHQKFNY